MSFQSYKYLNYLGYDEKTKLYSYEYEITDSEFGSEIVVSLVPLPLALPVIQIYSKRNLPVAPNLLLCMRLIESEYSWNIQEQIICYKKYIPEHFNKYEEDIKKYLLLM